MTATAIAPKKNTSSKLKKKPMSKDAVTAWALGIASAVWFAIIMIVLTTNGGAGSYQYDGIMHGTLATTNVIAGFAVGIGVVIWGRQRANAFWVIVPRLVVIVLWIIFMVFWFDDFLHGSGVRSDPSVPSSAEALWIFWKSIPVAGPIIGAVAAVLINVAAFLFLLWLPKGKPQVDWNQRLAEENDNLTAAKAAKSASKARQGSALQHKDDAQQAREDADTRANDAAEALTQAKEDYNEDDDVQEKMELEKELNDPNGDYLTEKDRLTKLITDTEATPDSAEKQTNLNELRRILKELENERIAMEARITILANTIKHSPAQATLDAAETESTKAVEARTQAHNDLDAADGALSKATADFAIDGGAVKRTKETIKMINQRIKESRRRLFENLRDFAFVPVLVAIMLFVATVLYTMFYGSVIIEVG